MNYKRTYWLLFLGSGILLVLGEVPAMAAGDLGAGTFLAVLGGTIMAFFSGRALSNLDAAGGPERADFRFGIVVVAFVLILIATIASLLLF